MSARQTMRLGPRPGEVINRDEEFSFSWNGRSYPAYRGDTIISALAASGERVFSRSFKYHRPRGLMTASYLDPGCIVQVDSEPNVRAAHRLAEPGLVVTAQNAWPSLRFDVKAANRLIGRFLSAGFYYKTFIRPRSLWPLYQRVLRRFSAGGTVPPPSFDGSHHDKRYAHPDVLVAGGGPAGMTAALAAAAQGARVMLVEEEHALGGHLRWGPLPELRVLIERVEAAPGIEVLTDSVVAGRYDGNWVAVVERDASSERLIKARAKTLVVAPGLIERPYVVAGNDLPGVMLSTAARRLINLHAVKPGHRAVVLTANASGDAAIVDLRSAGVEIACVVDARDGGDVVRVHGRRGVRAVETADGKKIPCDLFVTATGWTAPTSLLNMSGARPVYDKTAARFLPGPLPDDVLATGGIAGDGTLTELQAHAEAAGAEAARRAAGHAPRPLPSLPTDPHPELFRGRTHGIVDFSEDVSSKDLIAAVAEGYDSVELAKRYTTATMGPAQGKLETVNTVAIVAEATERSIEATGTTTWRPPYAPITLAALAGWAFEPVRHSPMQPWHAANGAKPLVAGAWIRPDYYGDPATEVRAVRENVGIIDVTPLGKLDLRGPDVPKLLNLLYVNKWSKLALGQVRYGVMCTEDGVVFDDGVTGRLADERYLMSTTSSGAAAVWEWAENWLQTEHPEWQVHVTPLTTAYASINVAGPQSRALLERLAPDIDLDFGYMRVRTARLAGIDDCVLWRIGFTGELSFELHVPAAYGLAIWELLLEEGRDLGVRPFGVEAQRILRLEKGHSIVGQDTDGLTRGFSAGLDRVIKLDKDDFVGKPELTWQRQSGDGMRLVALQPVDRTVVPAEASQIVSPAGIEGIITSSRMSPTLGRSICLARVAAHLAEPGTEVTVRLPDARRIAAHVMPELDHLGERPAEGEPPEARSKAPEFSLIARSPIAPPEPAGEAHGWEVSTRRNTAELTLTDLTPLAKVQVKADPDGGSFMDVSFGCCRRVETPAGDSLPPAGLRSRRIETPAEGSLPPADLIVGSGPGEWLLIGPPNTAASTVAWCEKHRAAGFVTVTDLTHGRALIRLTGDRSPQVLARVCAIDLAAGVTPDGSAFRSSVAKLATDVVRDDVPVPGSGARLRSYLLHCERSSGQYLFDALLDAGAEFGIEVTGFPGLPGG